MGEPGPGRARAGRGPLGRRSVPRGRAARCGSSPCSTRGLGLGPLALVPWKRPVVQRGLRRMRPGRTDVPRPHLGAAGRGAVRAAAPRRADRAVARRDDDAAARHRRRARGGPHRRSRRPAAGARPTAGLGSANPAAHRRRGRRGRGSRGRGDHDGAALARAGDRRSTGSFRLDEDEMPVTQWFLDTVPDRRPAGVAAHRGHPARRAPAEPRRPRRGDEVTAALDCTGGWWARADLGRDAARAAAARGRPRAERRRDQQHRVCASPPVDRRPPARDVDGWFATDGGPRRSGPARRAGPTWVPLGQVGRARRGRRRSLVGPATPPAALTSPLPARREVSFCSHPSVLGAEVGLSRDGWGVKMS